MAGKFGVSMTDPQIRHAHPQRQPDVDQRNVSQDAALPSRSARSPKLRHAALWFNGCYAQGAGFAKSKVGIFAIAMGGCGTGEATGKKAAGKPLPQEALLWWDILDQLGVNVLPKIGYLSEDRLQNIPKRHWAAHEFSFYLQDLIADLTYTAEQIGAGHIHIKLETERDIAALKAASNPIDFLSATGRADEERRLMVNHICAALFPDMLHFIHAGLTALEKRKFTLAFACFRKPFNEGLPLVALLCADEKDFFMKFKNDPVSFLDGGNFNRRTKRLAIEAAIAKCSDASFMSADVLYTYLFDFKNASGFAGLFDKAMHLVTRNPDIKTEAYNLNFIFKDPRHLICSPLHPLDAN